MNPDTSDIRPQMVLEQIEDHLDDPTVALPALGILSQWLNNQEADLVLKARVEGWPWSRIGDALGRSKQAVWERYRDPDPSDTPNT